MHTKDGTWRIQNYATGALESDREENKDNQTCPGASTRLSPARVPLMPRPLPRAALCSASLRTWPPTGP